MPEFEDEAQREMTLEEQLVDHRDKLDGQLKYLKVTAAKSQPPVVQEIVLAQRHLEDARMRLGVALAYEKGFDPFSSKVEEKK